MIKIPQILTANKLKAIAIIAMFFDHFMAVFIPLGKISQGFRLTFRLILLQSCQVI